MNILPRWFFAPALLLAPTLAHAISLTNFLYEGFNYTTTDNPADNTSDGDIGGNTGGTGWGIVPSEWSNSATTNTSTVLNIVNPGLSYPGLLTSGNALNLNAANPVGGTANSIQNFFRAFNQGGSIDSGVFYFSVLLRKEIASERTINLAFFEGTTEKFAVGQFSPAANDSNGTFGATQLNAPPLITSASPIAFGIGATYLLVGKVEFNTGGADPTFDRFTLYVNPTTSAEPATPYFQVATANLGGLDRVRPFVGNTSGADTASSGTYDDIRLGPTYQSVTPVPEPGSVSLLGFCATVLLARRRRA
ncbi:MAG TPA: PEP-CTERM sorting domain-containing protein [Chthoniobacteraceae bacterium]|jgi:hypothetical protein|nr:hypothetical protein [Chthoniobacter sp.]HEV7867891.1 PEP-CTERM sorting domain-containing protein [Chthoniobacteraceae bacterium]